jgi:iron complex outermembrane receptor protein
MPKLPFIAWLAFASATSLTVHAADQAPQADTAEPATPKAAPAAKAPAPSKVQQVNVNGARANETETRRDSTASKMIFGREELDRNGDSNVGEILKRLPGITMGGPPGRGGGGGARMRGLGNGYTQMLVNGERPPAGFSLESLAPEQVERIEVMRGPVAEHSTQAIAGTINIVLREGYQQKDMQLKLTDSIEQGLHSPNVSLTVPGKRGAMTWLINGSLGVNRNRDAGSTAYREVGPDGELDSDQLRTSAGDSTNRMLHLAPRLSYKFDNGDTLNVQPFIVSSRNHGTARNTLVERIDPASAEYALSLGSNRSALDFMRGFGNWLHRMGGGARLDVKFGFGSGRNRVESARQEYTAAGTADDVFSYREITRNHGLSYGGKYTRPLGKGHLLAAGWDIEAQRRIQTADSLRNGLPQYAGSGAELTADTRRVAAFIQDEWDITPQWGVYLGLRWEGIRTNADTPDRRAISNTSRVWSPVLHTVYRIPGHAKDQVRASVTSSYKAPGLNDMIAATTFAEPNDATRPDRSGNPNLKPELAKGLDLAYEHYIGKSGIVSASAFVRQIDNLQRRKLTTYVLDNQLRYLSTPSNVGSARTSGIELEAKFQLADLMKDAPNLDLRANYSRFWSSVDGIPGPDNRLDQQARQSANLGLDYRLKKSPLSVGGSYNWTPAVVVQTSVDERNSTGAKRQFDAYALWKFNPNTQLRVSANNMLQDDYLSASQIASRGRLFLSDNLSRTYTSWSVKLEMKL